ncbi:MAG: hypothetical protein EU549_01790 [Promethearchaeota archaeon]|nr:MAG: hypothetical protein EU549_01790 [Candidatus Lokiarchaeota archaeon]
MITLFLQIFIGICYLVLVIVLFFERKDYLTYAFIITIIAGVVSFIIIPEEILNLEFFIDAINWEVIFFLIGMFTIVAILDDKKIFHELARRLANRYKKNIRKYFYSICLISTIVAALLEDLSVAIIFGPIIIVSCRDMDINPTPFLLGMTICINIASTLLPFGSAESVLIVNALNLNTLWFITYFGLYFVITTLVTIFLVDKLILKKYVDRGWREYCENRAEEEITNPEVCEIQDVNYIFFNHSSTDVIYDNRDNTENISDFKVDKKTFYKNLIALIILIVILIIIPTIYLPVLIGLIIFIIINPVKKSDGTKSRSISHYFRKVDYKLVFFFMFLFILVGLMEANGTILYFETFISNIAHQNLFLLCLLIIFISSILSGFLDNVPVTLFLLPIISLLIGLPAYSANFTPIVFSFILGINLGGNFLPQGSAADMMTLEISRNHCVYDLSYKRLFKIGGLFAILHILIGVGYLTLIIFVFP